MTPAVRTWIDYLKDPSNQPTQITDGWFLYHHNKCCAYGAYYRANRLKVERTYKDGSHTQHWQDPLTGAWYKVWELEELPPEIARLVPRSIYWNDGDKFLFEKIAYCLETAMLTRETATYTCD